MKARYTESYLRHECLRSDRALDAFGHMLVSYHSICNNPQVTYIPSIILNATMVFLFTIRSSWRWMCLLDTPKAGKLQFNENNCFEYISPKYTPS